MTTEPVTLKALAKTLHLRCDYGAALDYAKQDDWQRKANGYRCTLRYQRRQFSFDYWMGVALEGEPDAYSVLDSLLSDSQAGMQDFEEFCSEFGYDQDSRKAEAVWQACRKTAKGMRRLLGTDFDRFLYAERND